MTDGAALGVVHKDKEEGTRWLDKSLDFWIVRILGLIRPEICQESQDFGPKNGGKLTNILKFLNAMCPTSSYP